MNISSASSSLQYSRGNQGAAAQLSRLSSALGTENAKRDVAATSEKLAEAAEAEKNRMSLNQIKGAQSDTLIAKANSEAPTTRIDIRM